MLFEPFNQFCHAPMNLTPVPESVRGHCEVLDPGLGTRLVAQAEFAGELLGGAKEVWDALGVLQLLFNEELFELIHLTTTTCSVALV